MDPVFDGAAALLGRIVGVSLSFEVWVAVAIALASARSVKSLALWSIVGAGAGALLNVLLLGVRPSTIGFAGTLFIAVILWSFVFYGAWRALRGMGTKWKTRQATSLAGCANAPQPPGRAAAAVSAPSSASSYPRGSAQLNWPRGLLRLWIVASGLWLIGAGVALRTDQAVIGLLEPYDMPTSAAGWQSYSEREVGLYSHLRGREWVEADRHYRAIQWKRDAPGVLTALVAPPLVLLCFGLIGRWVVRGFRPQKPRGGVVANPAP